MKVHSDDITEIAKALLAVQSEVKGVVKNQSTQSFNKNAQGFDYADLAAVVDAIRESLTNNNLAITQIPSVIDNEQILITMLMHTSGQYITSTYKIDSYVNKQIELIQERNKIVDRPKDINVQWIVGGAISYAKRYTLCAMVGIVEKNENDSGIVVEHDVHDYQPVKKKYTTENEDTKNRFKAGNTLVTLCRQNAIDPKVFAQRNNISSEKPDSVKWAIDNFEQLKNSFFTSAEVAA